MYIKTKTFLKMKKVFSIIAVALVATMVSCGPSAEEKAKMEERAKQMQDSISASISASMENTEAVADSTAPAAATETVAAPAEEAHAH
jgi:predicted lipoprotein